MSNSCRIEFLYQMDGLNLTEMWRTTGFALSIVIRRSSIKWAINMNINRERESGSIKRVNFLGVANKCCVIHFPYDITVRRLSRFTYYIFIQTTYF